MVVVVYGPSLKTSGTTEHSDVPRYQNQNECTFRCSPVPKTGTRVHSPKPPFFETALLFPLDLELHCNAKKPFPQTSNAKKPFPRRAMQRNPFPRQTVGTESQNRSNRANRNRTEPEATLSKAQEKLTQKGQFSAANLGQRSSAGNHDPKCRERKKGSYRKGSFHGISSFSKISKVSRISRKWTVLQKTHFPKDPFFRTRKWKKITGDFPSHPQIAMQCYIVFSLKSCEFGALQGSAKSPQDTPRFSKYPFVQAHSRIDLSASLNRG